MDLSGSPRIVSTDSAEKEDDNMRLPPLRRRISADLSPNPPRVVLPVDIKSYSPHRLDWSTEPSSTAAFAPAVLRLVTWNVDFMTPDAERRVTCILDHLEDTVLAGDSSPSCILLQELKEDSFEELCQHRWVREHYAITPPNVESWKSYYGVATLVSRNVRASNAQRVHFTNSHMGRIALFVDIEMSIPGSDETRVVRIANTHLESLPVGERRRPTQLQTIADKLREADVTGGGIVGGDMNMIGPADQDIHVRAGLQDACDDPEAVTWGFQPPTRFSPGRLDRVFYVGEHLEVAPVEVIGKGLTVMNSGEWASDHYGLATTVKLRSLRAA